VITESFRLDQGERDYDTRVADIWSLGIILINIVCGIEFVPWLSAQISDEHFSRFLRDPTRVRLYLPISSTFLPLLLRILDPQPATRISLNELRKELQKVPRFLMDDAELAEATEEAREGMVDCSHALGVPYMLPPPRRPVPPVRPRHSIQLDTTQFHRRMFSFSLKLPFRSAVTAASPTTPSSTELVTPPDSPIMSPGSMSGKKPMKLSRGFRLLKLF
jgi:serine/threonine protein kinase